MRRPICSPIYAHVYSAGGSGFSVDLTRLGGEGGEITAQWFDPREGIHSRPSLRESTFLFDER